jgi:hypothetical protein
MSAAEAAVFSINKLTNHQINKWRDPGEIRTLDPLIKSQLLYQLSYGVILGVQSKYLKWM